MSKYVKGKRINPLMLSLNMESIDFFHVLKINTLCSLQAYKYKTFAMTVF